MKSGDQWLKVLSEGQDNEYKMPCSQAQLQQQATSNQGHHGLESRVLYMSHNSSHTLPV